MRISAERDLSGADLRGAVLDTTNLYGANPKELVSKVYCCTTPFLVRQIRAEASGLASCEHLEPSVIDHQTLARSGPLPLAFLRGCGLPDVLIDYPLSLLNQPIQFYSCLISYSRKDQDFAERLHANLQKQGRALLEGLRGS